MKQGGLNAGFFAVSNPARSQTPLSAMKSALRIVDVIIEEVERHSHDLFLATRSDDARRAQREGTVAVFIGIEGGHMIDSSLEVLRQLYRLGARYMGLTHSGNTPWVGAAEYDDGPEGLTDFGKEVVREMNRLGMMIDLSHASDRAFFETVETSRAPILNTHAACRSVSNHPRNLTDDMLTALAQNGGVLGVARTTPACLTTSSAVGCPSSESSTGGAAPFVKSSPTISSGCRRSSGRSRRRVWI